MDSSGEKKKGVENDPSINVISMTTTVVVAGDDTMNPFFGERVHTKYQYNALVQSHSLIIAFSLLFIHAR
jgi:hypothetical protein